MNPSVKSLREAWLPSGRLCLALRKAAPMTALSLMVLALAISLGRLHDPVESAIAERKRVAGLVDQVAHHLIGPGSEAALGALAGEVYRSGLARGVFARRADGSLLTVHGAVDLSLEALPGPSDLAIIDLTGPEGRWGRIGIAFAPLPTGPFGLPGHPFIGLAACLALGNFTAFLLWLRYRPLRMESANAVLPDRVSTVMNGLTEGIALLDQQSRIVHCNRSFARWFGASGDELRGRPLSSFDWRPLKPGATPALLPWEAALATGRKQIDQSLLLQSEGKGERVISVSVTPMFDDAHQPRAAVASFDDRTAIAQKNRALRKALTALERQRREIALQNEELKGLATRDPLTGCLNRRAFLEIFEAELVAAQKRGYALACVMCDIDRFKAINDANGHTVGDRVIGQVANLMQLAMRENDHLCRYGGEEFCVLLPGLTSAEAAVIAERMRATIESQTGGLVRLSDTNSVTASFGVADLAGGATTLSELIDHADAALYAAKAAGRNRVNLHVPPTNVLPINGARQKS